MVPFAAAAESTQAGLGRLQRSVTALSPSASPDHSPTLIANKLNRGYLREEPYAGKPHVRICEGEAEWLSYSTTLFRCWITQFSVASGINQTLALILQPVFDQRHVVDLQHGN